MTTSYSKNIRLSNQAEDRFDKEEDCIDDQYVGSKLKDLYENGWFSGTVKYFNTSLEEYCRVNR